MGWYEKMNAGPWSEEDSSDFLKNHEDVISEAGFYVVSSKIGKFLDVNLAPVDPSCNCAKLSLFDNFFGGELKEQYYITADDSGRPVRFTQMDLYALQ